MKKAKSRTLYLTTLALLMALELLMAFIPNIGYIRIGVVSATLLPIPVAVGAVMLGPLGGGILGGVFGLTSFYQCFGMDAFGVMLMGISPVKTFLLCFVPRALMGVLVGLIFRGLCKIRGKHFPTVSAIVSCAFTGVALAAILYMNTPGWGMYLFAAAAGIGIGLLYHFIASLDPKGAPVVLSSCSAALLNTLFFISLLLLFFGNNATVLAANGAESIMDLVKLLVTVNAVIEAAVSLVLGTVVNKILMAIQARVQPEKSPEKN